MYEEHPILMSSLTKDEKEISICSNFIFSGDFMISMAKYFIVAKVSRGIGKKKEKVKTNGAQCFEFWGALSEHLVADWIRKLYAQFL